MNISQHFLTKNDCYKKGLCISPKGVMVHSTGANNTKITRYVSDSAWNKPGVQKCVHAFIGKDPDGKIATWQTLPWDMRGWHAGGKANDTHIGFEICEDNLTSLEYFDSVYREAVELTAFLCASYCLDPLKQGVVICHCEGHKSGIASNHADVMHWFPKHGKSMDTFRQDVYAAMNGDTVEELLELWNEMMVALSGQPPVDFAGSAEYRSRVEKAGIMQGDGTGNGLWAQPPTREQLAATLCRFEDYLVKTYNLSAKSCN